MKTVMISGNFDPFHYAHLDYIKKASELGELVCIVSSDKQVIIKKRKVNEPESERAKLVSLVLLGLGIKQKVFVNIWDTDNMLVAEALRFIHPDIFCRGSDKDIEDMPLAEWKACEELGIEIVHIDSKVQVHGSTFGRIYND